MSRTLAAALGAAFLLAGPAPARAEPENICVRTAVLKDAYRAVFTHARLIDMRGSEAGAYVSRLNEAPPRSSYTADRVLLLIFPASVLVSLSSGGKVCQRIQIGLPLHHALMAAAKGVRS